MLRVLVGGLLAVILVSAIAATAARLEVRAAPLTSMSFPANIKTPTPEKTLAASVRIEPDTLAKESMRGSVRAYIGLPADYDASKINVASVRLCLGSAFCAAGVAGSSGKIAGDQLEVTFDRDGVIGLVKQVACPNRVTFTVSGYIGNRPFAGSAEVNLVDDTDVLTPTVTTTATAMPTGTVTAESSTGTPTADSELADGEATHTPTPTPAESETPTPAASELPTQLPVATATPTPIATPEPTTGPKPEDPTIKPTDGAPEATPVPEATEAPDEEPASEPTADAEGHAPDESEPMPEPASDSTEPNAQRL